MPSVHAMYLSSFGAAQASRCPVTKIMVFSQAALIKEITYTTLFKKDLFPWLYARDVFGSGSPAASPPGGLTNEGAETSPLVDNIRSSRLININRTTSAAVMAKKYPSQPKRRQRYVRWMKSISFVRPELIEPKPTMPITPRTTTMVP